MYKYNLRNLATLGKPAIRLRVICAVLCVIVGLIFNSLPVKAMDEADNLRQKYTVLKQYLENNQFYSPLYLNSVELNYSIRGDIYAVMDYPFPDIMKALNDPEKGPLNLCRIMILHPNTKYCRVARSKDGKMLHTKIGRKSEQPLDEAYDMNFSYRNESPPGSGYLRIDLRSDSGPFSTKDYRIMIRMVGLGTNRSFMHLSYSLGYGFAARTAMKAYLATIGRKKVGFTRVDNPRGG